MTYSASSQPSSTRLPKALVYTSVPFLSIPILRLSVPVFMFQLHSQLLSLTISPAIIEFEDLAFLFPFPPSPPPFLSPTPLSPVTKKMQKTIHKHAEAVAVQIKMPEKGL